MMLVLACLPFVAATLLHFLGPRLVGAMPPRAATWLLMISALTVALTCGLMLSGLAVISIAQSPAAARAGRWSAAALRNAGSPPLGFGMIAAAVVVILLATAARRLVVVVRALDQARRTIRRLPISGENLSVVSDPVPIAYAVGGRSGRIVVSTGMLNALSPAERRVLLVHEQAHLRHRHLLFVQAVELAAAANALLKPLVPAVRRSTERWADEVAAAAVGDRQLAARSLARASMLTHAQSYMARMAGRGTAFGMADGDVPARVRALLAPPLDRQWRSRAVFVGCIIVCWTAGLIVSARLHSLIETAQTLYGR